MVGEAKFGLTFSYALDVSAATERMIVESDGGRNTVLDEAAVKPEGFVSPVTLCL